MKPGKVSYFNPSMERVVKHDGMLSIRILIIYDKKLWGIRRGSQLTNIFYIGNINGSWNKIRGIPGLFFGWGLFSMGMGGVLKSRIPP